MAGDEGGQGRALQQNGLQQWSPDSTGINGTVITTLSENMYVYNLVSVVVSFGISEDLF